MNQDIRKTHLSLVTNTNDTPSPKTKAIHKLKRTLSYVQLKKHQAEEEIFELKEENEKLKEENDAYQEKLRCGIKRAKIYLRDKSYTDLESLTYQTEGINCIVEVGKWIASGTYKHTHDYMAIQTDLATDLNFTSGVLKYYILDNIPPNKDSNAMADHDCKKQWYLSDMATKFAISLGLNPQHSTVPKFLPCAKVVFRDETAAVVEPKLKNFERITNNMGDGLDDVDDMLSAYMHYVFVSSGRKYLPCDFQGDEYSMLLTDPEINTWSNNPEFLGIENNGKRGVLQCLSYHLEKNCDNNKYCLALNLTNCKIHI